MKLIDNSSVLKAWAEVLFALDPTYIRAMSHMEDMKLSSAFFDICAEFKRHEGTIAMPAPTVSDVMDRVTNLTLRGQIFKIVGLHAPNYTEVADLGQRWMDAIGNLLKISNGSTFYVSGRTKVADGSMRYSPPHQATSFLLMVAAEKGDACKSKGVYNTESDIGEVLTLMHRFSGFQNPDYTIFYDAEHVYPGVVP